MLFLLLRGYFSDIMGRHRAKAAFKQNLESATLNPADASAHYNLGLIHQSRGELDQARERLNARFRSSEEIDASYQLGRIARQQKRYADAIQNFEHVVVRDPAHSQHEIWREVAATYIAAGQFEDARTALDQFLGAPAVRSGRALSDGPSARGSRSQTRSDQLDAGVHRSGENRAGLQVSREQALVE